ncbi:NUDIX domain-containing protein [Kitasatospora sp. NPDC088134]|uniref:NUDIX domain-containing protein n=1 Tax=Kitasatospora sp. NPDC088134 TaxID=3364071 RepID=UPI00382BEABB
MTDTTTSTTGTVRDSAATIRYTADTVILDSDGRVLLIERGHPAYQGLLALPGGHVNVGETSRRAAAREALEETGILVNPDDLVFVGLYDEPDRDPRGRYIGTAYLARVPAGTFARAGDDAAAVHWTPIDALPERLAFDHAQILADARRIASGR